MVLLKLYVSMNHILQLFFPFLATSHHLNSLFQMADVSGTSQDGAGHTHTNGLHWEGFSRLLWESLQLFCYTELL